MTIRPVHRILSPQHTVRIIYLALLCGLTAQLLIPSAAAQSDGSDALGKEAIEKTKDRIEWALERLEQDLDIGEKAGEIIRNSGKSRPLILPTKTGAKIVPEAPQQHPMIPNDGADPNSISSEEYTQEDSEAIFHDDTVAQCLEDRQVFNGAYISRCAQICPGPFVRVAPGCPRCNPLRDPNCVLNSFYVSEVYFPIYQTRTYPGRAMGSFNPTGNYLSGADRRAELKLQATKQRYRQEGWQIFKEIYQKHTGKSVEDITDDGLEELIPRHLWNTEWGGTDRSQENDPSQPYSFHSLTYQTNGHRQTTRNRPPPFWQGYFLQNNCFYHTLDNASKEVIAHATYGDEQYMRLQMSADETNRVEPETGRSTIIQGGPNMFDVAASVENIQGGRFPAPLNQLDPSQRMTSWDWMRQGLARSGFQERGTERDWVYYADTLGPFYSNAYNSWHTPLYAAFAQGVSHFWMNGRKDFAPNRKRRRPIQFSFHSSRPSESNYAGNDDQVNDKIIFTDKVQVIYPPLEANGKRRGSHCFRPETLSRMEEVRTQDEMHEITSSGHAGLRRDLAKMFPENGVRDGLNFANEVRMAHWTKRVNCYCTMCGVPYGCVVMNNGDHEEDNFYGTTPMRGNAPQLFAGGIGIPIGQGSQASRTRSATGNPKTILVNDTRKKTKQKSFSDQVKPKTPEMRRRLDENWERMARGGGNACGPACTAPDWGVKSRSAVSPKGNTHEEELKAGNSGSPGPVSPGSLNIGSSNSGSATDPPAPPQFNIPINLPQIIACAGGGGGCSSGNCSPQQNPQPPRPQLAPPTIQAPALPSTGNS